MVLSLDEAKARIEALKNGGGSDATPVPSAPQPVYRNRHGQMRDYRHYRPLSSVVDEIIEEVTDPVRIYFGIEKLDKAMRGIGRGHFCLIVGASHSGKTQLTVQLLKHNKTNRCLLVTPDETAAMILAKVTAIETGVDAELLEARLAQRDPEYVELLRDVAEGQYPNLIVVDNASDPQAIEEAWDEATAVWGAPPQVFIFDYVQLLDGFETVQAQMSWLKGFGKRMNVATVAIHQTSRGSGKEGQEITIDSGSYGGETHATFMIGVRRKWNAYHAERKLLREKIERTGGKESDHDRLAEIERELEIHNYTVTVNLVKNKRLGGGKVDEFDMELMFDSGALVPLEDGDLPRQYLESRRYRNAPIASHRAASYNESTDYDQEEMF